MRVAIFGGALFAAIAAGQTALWLDLPLSPWNKPGAAIPAAPAGAEGHEALSRRCGEANAGKVSAAAVEALSKSGWTPFLHVDREIRNDDIEIIGGMSAATPECDATAFNLFVFVGGAFAGTLSPAPMTAARDGVIGAVRLSGADSLTAEFARYKPEDPECCSSSRARVSFQIDRAGSRPTVIPAEVRQIR